MNMKRLATAALLLINLSACGQDNTSERERNGNNQAEESSSKSAAAESASGIDGRDDSSQGTQVDGRCLCGPCGTPGAAAPLALDAAEQEFRVTIRFSAPIASLAGKFLNGSVGGRLKEPKTDPSRPCVPPAEGDEFTVFDLSGAQAEIIRQSADGILEVTVLAKATLTRAFYDSLVEAKFFVSLQHEEPSAAAGEMNRYHDAGGDVTLTGFEQSAYEISIDVNTDAMLPVVDPKG